MLDAMKPASILTIRSERAYDDHDGQILCAPSVQRSERTEQGAVRGPPELFDQDVDAAEPVLGLHDQAVDRCLSHLCNQPL